MIAEDMILISIDDHIVEPPDMFLGHVPAKWLDEAPRIVTDEFGVERWVFQGVAVATTGLNAVVSWPKEEWGMDPSSRSEMRPGAYDVNERVRDMSRNGVLASMCFPSFVGFSAGTFFRAEDKALSLVMLKAYNDWHLEEWCGSNPGRFIPLAIGPFWDLDALVAEVRRTSAKGFGAISMPELPHTFGLPSYRSDVWAPFFRALCEVGMVMCLHIGPGFNAISTPPDGPIDDLMILATQVSALAAQDLLWGPAFSDYPELKVAWSEAGIGWIPFYLDRCDRHYTNQRWLGHDFGDELPSDRFRRHSLACYVTDPSALKLRDSVGLDSIAWECDFPHSDGLWPDAPEFVLAELQAAGASDQEINKITWKNTVHFFNLDPFRHVPESEATVGALRATAADVDTTIRPRAEWKARFDARANAMPG